MIRIDSVSETVAANVRRIRMAKGLTLSNLAVLMDHHLQVSALSKVETNTRAVSAEDLVALAHALEVAVTDLLSTETCLTCGQLLPVITSDHISSGASP